MSDELPSGKTEEETDVSLQAITEREPIPGYRICERLGAGGYGEVWKVDAPGGLAKAIKFVYGHLNEDRAARELKALSRIKAVRHPFLLSLERIEVVDGQLLIVTELADMSLKDRFDQCCKEGLSGIARDELLRYLQDTADVLDYMNEEYSLQHLDIKPENLLLLAGRVKVADFGLVKDLHDVTASMMGGLTPLYAPPEVFDGRPSHWSDQYSLAIVYQEMLTGKLPFPGTSAMQLARQHMYAQPRLAALPESDRPIIARALSKTPEHRFASCRELIGALTAGISSTPSVNARPVTGNRPATSARRVSTRARSAATRFRTNARLPKVDPQPQLTTLPPVEPVNKEQAAMPILYIGIGGTGNRVVAALHKRFVADEFQPSSAGIAADESADSPAHENSTGASGRYRPPATLLLDTDAKDLGQVLHMSSEDTSEPPPMLAVPLRQAQSYRQQSGELLSWLSRRWLYNIPRSLKTEGLRPLGRLALVDHAAKIRSQLQQTLDELLAAPAASAATKPSQTHESAPQRIVVVASISGGTGSGMLIDLGYMVRQLLEERARHNIAVHAVLLHSTGRTAHWKELAVVNAYATLSELYHFSQPNNAFPGDASCGLAARPAAGLPFDEVELIECGRELDETGYHEAVARVVDRLLLDTPSSAGPLFDACRVRQTGATSRAGLTTTGVCTIRCLDRELLTNIVEHICHGVVTRWIHGDQVPVKDWLTETNRATSSLSTHETERPNRDQLTPIVKQWFAEEQFDVPHVMNLVSRTVDQQLPAGAEQFLKTELAQLLPGGSEQDVDVRNVATSRWRETLDDLFGARWDDDTVRLPRATVLESVLETERKSLGEQIAKPLRDRTFALVQEPKARVRGANWAAQYCCDYCQQLDDQLRRVEQSIEQQLQRLEAELPQMLAPPQGQRAPLPDIREPLHTLGELRLRQFVVIHARSIVREVKVEMMRVADELADATRRLRQLADTFDTAAGSCTPATSGGTDDAAASLRDKASGFLAKQLPVLIDRTEHLIDQHDPAGVAGLQHLLEMAGPATKQFPALLREMARLAVREAVRQFDTIGMLFRTGAERDAEVRILANCLEAAQPALANCGGAQRLLVMLPDGTDNPRPLEILHQELHEVPSAMIVPSTDFVVCRRIEDIPFTQVAVTLIEQRPDYVEFAQRLHTRRDIKWSELPDLV